MDDEFLALLVDLHKGQQRQGPGGDAETERALSLSSISRTDRINVADIGCGTGAATLQLARSLNADITAVDFLSEFLEILEKNARAEGLSGKIKPVVGSMEALSFGDEELDVIWSEGAIYNMGFRNGVTSWRRFLKPGGVLVVSEITWITGTRPDDLQKYWEGEYPEIGTASSKFAVLEECGYAPVGYFVLPETCWLENYYIPLHEGLPAFAARHAGNEKAHAVAEAERNELELYRKYKASYSYGVYIAQKTGAP